MGKGLFTVMVAGVLVAGGATGYLAAKVPQGAPAQAQPATPVAPAAQVGAAAVPPEKALINRYCVGCHNQRTKSGNIPDLYRAYGLDADAIIGAVARLCVDRVRPA